MTQYNNCKSAAFAALLPGVVHRFNVGGFTALHGKTFIRVVCTHVFGLLPLKKKSFHLFIRTSSSDGGGNKITAPN